MADNADLAAPPGGVETNQAGAVTGDLTISVERDGDNTAVRVKYRGAADEYEVVGSPVSGEQSAAAVARWLASQSGEKDSLGNEGPVTLRGYSSR